LLGALLVLAVARPAVAAPDPVRVVVYGDSLSAEAGPYLEGLAHDVAGVGSVVRAAPGGATCDLFDQMARDAARLRPALVIVQFSGNNLTACMRDREGHALTGEAWLAKYRADTDHAIRLLRPMRAPIWLATSPVGLLAERKGEDDVVRIAAMYRQLAARRAGVRVADAARSVLAFGRYWTRTLPCLAHEPCAGGVDTNADRVNQVRAFDGVHFCPAPHTSGSSCPVWSSGALRYALGLLVPALDAAGLLDRARFARSVGGGWRP
jgi:hypothetical protein